MRKPFLAAVIVCLLYGTCYVMAAEDDVRPHGKKILSFEEFVRLAAQNDTQFEAILIEELKLKYSETLALPGNDLVLSVRQEHDVYLEDDRNEPATSIGLSKLFPTSGTELSASYGVTTSFTSTTNTGQVELGIGQPIARNAFGRSTRLLKRITGLEESIARHQIVEAYEDYLASIMTSYHGWLETWQNLEIARSSYAANVKLLDNIKEREASRIAKTIDVNKVSLQVLAKQEKLIQLEEDYERTLTTVERALRHEGNTELVPEALDTRCAEMDFDKLFNAFLTDSRTFTVLELLEEKSSLEVDREADDLLPSIDLVAGVSARGDEHDLDSSDEMAFVGLEIEWPFPNSTARAELATAKIDLQRAGIDKDNARHRLYDGIKSLFYELRKEKRLIDVAAEKIQLAESILKDETENYSFGKVTLNDYISAVNTLDSQRFNQVLHETRYRRLMIEWKRLTDQLVTRRDVEEQLNRLLPSGPQQRP